MATRTKAPEFDILGNGTTGNRLGDFEGSNIILYRLGDIQEESHPEWGTRNIANCVLTILEFESDTKVTWFIRPYVLPVRAEVLVKELKENRIITGKLVKTRAYSLRALEEHQLDALKDAWEDLGADIQDAAKELGTRQAEREKNERSDKPPY